jgi:hypothetical protein
MFRPLYALSVIALSATPALGASYSAKVANPTDGRIIARDISWNCASSSCQGATRESRPAILCQGLAKKAGHIDAFTVDGRAFTAAELDKCNASAKGEKASSLAAQ